MKNRSHEQRTRWSSLALCGFALVLAFLVHDLLMTGDAHHATAATPHDSGHHRAAMEHPDESVVDANLPLAGTTAEHDGCGYLVLAAPPSSDPVATSGRYHPILAVDTMDRATSVAPTETVEPTTPPGVRRALLQVFLI